LKRVLILHADADAAVAVRGLRELLVAEFAVQALPTVYARSVGEAGETPEVVLAHAGGDPPAVLQALHALRRARRTTDVPVIVLARPDAGLDPAAAFGDGADDVLFEPVQPAQLRARVR